MTENVVRLQEMGSTREAADALYRQWVANVAKGDANDQLCATEAVMDYDPAPLLEKITAKLLAINFADDAVNPPELGVVEPVIRQIPGRGSCWCRRAPRRTGTSRTCRRRSGSRISRRF